MDSNKQNCGFINSNIVNAKLQTYENYVLWPYGIICSLLMLTNKQTILEYVDSVSV